MILFKKNQIRQMVKRSIKVNGVNNLNTDGVFTLEWHSLHSLFVVPADFLFTFDHSFYSKY
jgi:hypothetical protein